MLAQIAFGLIAGTLLGAALKAVTSANLVHSVLWLAAALLSTAALYVSLEATFLAGIQIILYTGGVITLMLFAVMLTDDINAVVHGDINRRRWAGGVAAIAVFGLIAGATYRSDLPALPDGFNVTAKTLGGAFLGQHILAFEALSLLLLAALIGAVVVARRRDP